MNFMNPQSYFETMTEENISCRGHFSVYRKHRSVLKNEIRTNYSHKYLHVHTYALSLSGHYADQRLHFSFYTDA